MEKTLESPLDSKEIKPVNPKGNQLNVHWEDWCWRWGSNTLVTWYKYLIHWKRHLYWERLRVREGDNRGWEGCMASPTQWTWISANSGIYWRTMKTVSHQSIGSQRVGHDLEMDQQQQMVRLCSWMFLIPYILPHLFALDANILQLFANLSLTTRHTYKWAFFTVSALLILLRYKNFEAII